MPHAVNSSNISTQSFINVCHKTDSIERRQYTSIIRGEQIKTNELENDDTGPG